MTFIISWLTFCKACNKSKNMHRMKPITHSPLNFDQLFEELLSPRRLPVKSTYVRPAARVLETQSGFEIELLVPGFSKSDLSMTLNGDQLVVKGQATPRNEEDQKKVWLNEFQWTDFERKFQLPESIDLERIEAEVDRGMLCIKLPKKPEMQAPQPKQISIN